VVVRAAPSLTKERFELTYRDRPVALEVVDGRELVLRLDGVERKRRDRSGVECVYVWTNVELHWEEHHFIEARWWPANGRVRVTVNGKTLMEASIGQKD
jgi:hypothetical protein